MQAYTFEVKIAHDDAFLRHIEVLDEHTFLEFHQAILEAIDIKEEGELASFYLCDEQGDVDLEIALEDMSIDENDVCLLMADCIIGDYIKKKNQKMDYIYDFLHMYTFKVVLKGIKEIEVTDQYNYPVCSRKKGVFTPDTQELDFSFDDINE